jgi:membrane-associated phospholipid phosphatase
MEYSIEKIKSNNPIFYFIEYVGINSPILLYIISNYILFPRIRVLTLFNAGFILNYVLNGWLKSTLKHERPQPLILDRSKANYYGMPSGHAQMLSYMTAFIYLAVSSTYIYFVAFFVVFLWGCIERYVNKKHSIGQLVAGTIIGTCVALGMWNAWKMVVSSLRCS